MAKRRAEQARARAPSKLSPARRWACAALLLTAMIAVPTGADPAASFLGPFVGDVEYLEQDLISSAAIVLGSDGNLWFADSAANAIGQMTPQGQITTFTDPRVVTPLRITSGADGNLWFSMSGTGAVGRVSTAGEFDVFDLGGPPSAASITAGPDGNVWFATSSTDQIGRITPAGVVTLFSDPGISDPADLTAGPDGNVWFVNRDLAADAIGRITPAGSVATFDSGSGVYPDGLSAGPDGNLWYVGIGTIGRLTPAGVFTSFVDPAISSSAKGITAGPDGNLWFGNGVGSVGRVTTAGVVTALPTGTSSSITALTSGPDGNVWFSASNRVGFVTPPGAVTLFGPTIMSPEAMVPDASGNVWVAQNLARQITRISPSGVRTRYTSPSMPRPADLTLDADGNVWFTGVVTNEIARLTPAGALTVFADPGINDPDFIVAGNDGNLWFHNAGDGSIGRMTTSGVVDTFSDPAGSPTGRLILGPDGNVWFPDSLNAQMGVVSPTGAISWLSDPGVVAIGKLAVGPDGNVWFQSDPGELGRVTPAGVFTTFDPGIWFVHDLVGGDDGNIWVIAGGPTDLIARISTTGVLLDTFTDPKIHPMVRNRSMAPGANGSIWFLNENDSIGHMRTTQKVSDPPISPAATGDDTTVAVSWTAPAYAGAAPIASYTATAQPGGAACAAAPPATSCVITNLINDEPVTVTVIATNIHGDSLPTLGIDVTPSAKCGTGNTGPYTDVGPGHLFCHDIAWAQANLVVNGYPDGTFQPGGAMTRQSIAAFLHRLEGSPYLPPPGTPTFNDVGAFHPFFDEIEWLAAVGIASGYPDGTFRPSTGVSRQALATYLYRLAGEPAFSPPATPTFTDVPATHPFRTEIEWLASTGITTGYPDGSFHPTETITRQATTAFLHRYANAGL